MSEFLITVYLLIGFQMGGRMFYWDISIDRTIASFIMCLVIVPCLWPIVFILSLFPGGVHEALWKWDE